MQLSVGAELVAPAGKNLMTIGLMTDIPYQAVVGRVEDIVQCHRQFHDTQSGSQMSRVDRCLFYDVLPQGITHLRQLFHLQPAQVGRTVDALEYVFFLLFQLAISMISGGKGTK